MIISFKHKGLEQFFRTGSTVGIQAKHAGRLTIQLSMLNTAKTPMDMNAPSWNLHRLKGNLADPFGSESQWKLAINI